MVFQMIFHSKMLLFSISMLVMMCTFLHILVSSIKKNFESSYEGHNPLVTDKTFKHSFSFSSDTDYSNFNILLFFVLKYKNKKILVLVSTLSLRLSIKLNYIHLKILFLQITVVVSISFLVLVILVTLDKLREPWNLDKRTSKVYI